MTDGNTLWNYLEHSCSNSKNKNIKYESEMWVEKYQQRTKLHQIIYIKTV